VNRDSPLPLCYSITPWSSKSGFNRQHCFVDRGEVPPRYKRVAPTYRRGPSWSRIAASDKGANQIDSSYLPEPWKRAAPILLTATGRALNSTGTKPCGFTFSPSLISRHCPIWIQT
jgi:hypothetical protein